MLGRAKAWKHEPSFSSIKQSEHCVDNQRLGSTSTKKKHPPSADFGGVLSNGKTIAFFPEAEFGRALKSVGNVYSIRF